jgi:hypothetical protein
VTGPSPAFPQILLNAEVPHPAGKPGFERLHRRRLESIAVAACPDHRHAAWFLVQKLTV